MDSIDAVRLRRGMYFGDLDDGRALHHLVWEVVANVIDQHLMRQATELVVDVDDGWVRVADDGPGIPVDMIAELDRRALEMIFTQLRFEPTYDGHHPHVHVGPNMAGVGLAAVNAVCARLEVETTRNGIRWAQAYERGRPVSAVREIGSAEVEGTVLGFRPDPEIFGDRVLDAEQIRARLQELAWLNPLLRISFGGQRLPGRGGVRGWVDHILASRVTDLPPSASPVVYSTCQHFDNVLVDVALGWCDTQDTTLLAFANMQRTTSGTHIEGLWRGLGDWATHLGVPTSGATARARTSFSRGLVGVIHVCLFSPEFDGRTREHLAADIARSAVRRALATDLSPALERTSGLRDRLLARLPAHEVNNR